MIPIQIPPLRDRREDIPLLAEHFLDNFNRQKGRDVQGITPQGDGCSGAIQLARECEGTGELDGETGGVEKGRHNRSGGFA